VLNSSEARKAVPTILRTCRITEDHEGYDSDASVSPKFSWMCSVNNGIFQPFDTTVNIPAPMNSYFNNKLITNKKPNPNHPNIKNYNKSH
jgi:hypothetical protein